MSLNEADLGENTLHLTITFTRSKEGPMSMMDAIRKLVQEKSSEEENLSYENEVSSHDHE